MPVAGAVVRGEADRHDRADGEHAVYGPRPVYHAAEAHHRHLWRVDHRQDGVDAELAEIGDCDRRVGHLLSGQPPGPGATDKVAQGRHQLVEIESLRIPDGGRDETAVPQGYRHAEMHSVDRLESTLHPVPVEVADLGRGHRDGSQEQRGRQHSPRRRAVAVAVAQPRGGHGEVHVGAQVEVRDVPLRTGHELAHRSLPAGGGLRPGRGGMLLRLGRVGDGGRRLRGPGRRALDIGDADRPARAGAGDRVEENSELPCAAPRQRGRPYARSPQREATRRGSHVRTLDCAVRAGPGTMSRSTWS